MMTRHDERKLFDVPTRLALLEVDGDDFETGLDGLRKETNENFQKTNRLLMGVLVSIATGTIMLALNVIVSAN